MRLKLDENLGWRWINRLRDGGHDADTVRDEDLSGASDVDVLAAAVAERRTLVTLDLDFANPVRFPPTDTAGIAVLRVRDRPGRDDLDLVVNRLIEALATADVNGGGRIQRVDSDGTQERYGPRSDLPLEARS